MGSSDEPPPAHRRETNGRALALERASEARVWVASVRHGTNGRLGSSGRRSLAFRSAIGQKAAVSPTVSGAMYLVPSVGDEGDGAPVPP